MAEGQSKAGDVRGALRSPIPWIALAIPLVATLVVWNGLWRDAARDASRQFARLTGNLQRCIETGGRGHDLPFRPELTSICRAVHGAGATPREGRFSIHRRGQRRGLPHGQDEGSDWGVGAGSGQGGGEVLSESHHKYGISYHGLVSLDFK